MLRTKDTSDELDIFVANSCNPFNCSTFDRNVEKRKTSNAVGYTDRSKLPITIRSHNHLEGRSHAPTVT